MYHVQKTRNRRLTSRRLAAVYLLLAASLCPGNLRMANAAEACGSIVSLDGPKWLLAIDPNNAGIQRQWPQKPQADARATPVPWVIQDIFPDYHGLVWYWRSFDAPPNPDPQGRYLLRFWAVDYKADVWLNGVSVGGHEGGETPFTLDVTHAIKRGGLNLVAVRVLNPSDQPIDGITLKQTPHRNKTIAFSCGADYDHGGIEDSVELLVTPAVRMDDLFVRCNVQSGLISIQATIHNALPQSIQGDVQFVVSPAAGGKALVVKSVSLALPPKEKTVVTQVKLEHPRLWQLNDPYLYHVTARVQGRHTGFFDEQTTRCGFRELRLQDGCFRFNGRRLFLRGSVSGNMSPIGIHVPYDRDWLRHDLVNVKAMGFNAIRFYGLPTRFQLDLCDDLGLLVYEEPFSSQLYEDSPQMAQRFDRSTAEMVLRDRNHPCIVLWGLLNETADSAQFRHAVRTLALVRSLDTDRMVALSSGRFDGQLSIGSIANPGVQKWENLLGEERKGGPTTHFTTMPAYVAGVGDAHIYPLVPHQASDIRFLRTLGENTKPVLISEHGIGSAVDLDRVVRNYEQRNRGSSGECRFYRQALERFLSDWQRWRLAECFGLPQDFFRQSQASMTEQRLIAFNAIRSNAHIPGYFLTGTTDQGYTGEGLTTVFREPKPGTMDAMSDALSPLRFCLFAEPVNIYRGAQIRLDAILADEDVLSPGTYPVHIQVFGPDNQCVFDRALHLSVPDPGVHGEPALTRPVLAEEVRADWPTGKYRFVAQFESGAAATGGETSFYVANPAEMPKIKTEVTLWGEDSTLFAWLTTHGIPVRRFSTQKSLAREVILVGRAAPTGDRAQAFKKLTERIADGATVIFLDPHVFDFPGQPTSLHWLGKVGELVPLPGNVYHKDDWIKQHPIFQGLPGGGLMDYTFYRELVSDTAWSLPEAPAEAVAGGIYASTQYLSGLTVLVDTLGSGRILLNTLRLLDTLGTHPAAERLLRNMILTAAHDFSKSSEPRP